MHPVGLALAVALAVVALVVAGRAVPWLQAGGHRYADEADLPHPPFRWVRPVTGVAALLVGLSWTERPVLMVVLVAFTVFLVLVSAIDVDVQRLPDRWTFPAMGLAPVATGIVAVVDGDLSAWWRSLLAGLVLGGGYFLLVVVGAL